MVLQNDILKAENINDAMSVYIKLSELDRNENLASPCDTQLRSGPFILENQSQWDVEIMFMQLKSDLKPLPGYSNDTGVFVAAKNVISGRSETIDPCKAGGRNSPIQGTWMQYNAKMVIIWNGKKYEKVIESELKAPDGYIRQGRIRITQSPNLLEPDIQLVDFDDKDISEKRCSDPINNCPDV